jgi:hypothetical protein
VNEILFVILTNLKSRKVQKIAGSAALYLVVKCGRLVIAVMYEYELPAELVSPGCVQMNGIIRYMTDESKCCI